MTTSISGISGSLRMASAPFRTLAKGGKVCFDELDTN